MGNFSHNVTHVIKHVTKHVIKHVINTTSPSLNATNDSDTDYDYEGAYDFTDPSQAYRQPFTTVLLVIYVYVIAVICWNFKQFENKQFYSIVINLAVPDIYVLIYYAVPSILQNTSYATTGKNAALI